MDLGGRAAVGKRMRMSIMSRSVGTHKGSAVFP